ncbi:hypothetical protein BJX64DRAFT_261812 [Aspergillus heterothallicus]
MDQDLRKTRRTRRSGARSRKGILTCRARHTRCDEVLPICGNCRRSRQHCQQPGFISSKWNALVPTESGTEDGSEIPDDQCINFHPPTAAKLARHGHIEVQETYGILRHEGASSPTETKMTQETVHLLQVYEKSIATWMDVFDSQWTYQRQLLCMVPWSPLLLNAICALAARQLSLTGSALVWKAVAERYYGQAVHLLARLLNGYQSNDMELAVVASILLCSYELLAFPGIDYQRHFKGAHTLVQSLHAHKATSSLTRASFWIYARHEVAEALNRGSPTLHDPGLWPKFDLSQAEPAEDSFCNDVLRMAAESACAVFGETQSSRRPSSRQKRRLSILQDELGTWFRLCPRKWMGSEYEENGKTRYWFPRPNFAAALVFYHLSMLLLWYELEKLQKEPESTKEFLDKVDSHARQIILIALSCLPDSAIVVVVQPLCYAVKHVRDNVMREDAIILLDDIEARTGFHTRSKLERQMCG